MSTRESRIVLYGHFGSGNIGNDSSLEAMLHAVKKYRPTADVVCLCSGPQVVKERFGIETMEIGPTQHGETERPGNRLLSLFRKAWRRLSAEVGFWLNRPRWFRPGDQFIIVGTGAVDDMSVKHPWNAPYELYKWCSVARLGGARLIFLSVGVGPIVNRVSRFLMLKALKKADYRSYRETVAFDYLKSVGYDTSGDLLYPDLVFSLPKDSLPAPKAAASTPFVVGLGMINYYGWDYDPLCGERIYQEYTSKIKCFVAWLLDQGHTIRIISGDEVDQRPVYEIMEFVTKDKPSHHQNLIVERISDVSELFRQIAQTDIVIASRFHNVLCSLMLERPVISLGYHAKNDALMAEMGLASYCQHIERFTFETLVEQFERYTAEMDEAVRRIHHKNEMYRELLDEQYRTILIMNEKAHDRARQNAP